MRLHPSRRNDSRHECRGSRWWWWRRRRRFSRCWSGSTFACSIASGLCLGLQLLFTLALAAFSFFTCMLLGKATRFFRGLLFRLLFFSATKAFGLNTLALTALVLDALGLAAYGFFSLAALGVDLVLLLTSLLFEHIALDVGPLPTYFD